MLNPDKSPRYLAPSEILKPFKVVLEEWYKNEELLAQLDEHNLTGLEICLEAKTKKEQEREFSRKA